MRVKPFDLPDLSPPDAPLRDDKALAAAALLALLPAPVALLQAALDLPLPAHPLVAVWAVLFSAMYVTGHLRVPARFGGRTIDHPGPQDARLVERVHELAEAMGTAVPRLGVVHRGRGAPHEIAWVGGLASPTLIVDRSVLLTLAEDERDAVLAHELAHFSSRSLWRTAAAGPLSGCIVVLLGGLLHPLSAALFAPALAVGLRRLAARPAELECDRAAAEQVGAQPTVAALAKLDPQRRYPQHGSADLALSAVAPQPPRVTRVAELRSSEGTSTLPYDLVKRHRTAARFAFAGWLAALLAGLAVGASGAGTAAAAVFAAVAVFPSALPILLALHRNRSTRRSIATRHPGDALIGPGFWLLGAAAVTLLLPLSSLIPALLAAGGALLVGIGAFLAWPRHRMRRLVIRKLRGGSVDEALKLTREHASLLEPYPTLRRSVALMAARRGFRDEAAAELRRLAEQMPGNNQPLTDLALLLLEPNPEEALRAAAAAAERRPRDPVPRLLTVRALRRLERLPAADQALQEALRVAPESGEVLALEALLALDRGLTAQARDLAEAALDRNPGDALPLLARAEIAVVSQSPEEARAWVRQAVAAAAANPYIFLDQPAKELRRRLDRKTGDQERAVGAEAAEEPDDETPRSKVRAIR